MVQQKERMAQRRKMFQLAGTQLGNLLGAQKEEEGPKIGEGEFMASGDIVSGIYSTFNSHPLFSFFFLI